MAISEAELLTCLRTAFPDAQVKLTALVDDGDHYAAEIKSQAFIGKTRVQQHQMVYQALEDTMGDRMGEKLHALALHTSPPDTATANQENTMTETSQSDTQANTQNEIQSTIEKNPVVLFMKGNAMQPMCGFSATVVQILNHLGIEFHSINVLEDMQLREAIKSFSDWPTIPQLYVHGEFIGGCDIVREMFESGELQSLAQEKNLPSQ